MRPRACHVRACVCVCVCKSVNERERYSEREEGRERERNESEIVCACCSVLQFEPTPHAGCGFLAPSMVGTRRTRGVGFLRHLSWVSGFLRHLSWVSRAIYRAHKAHLSCVYPVLMSFGDVRAWGEGRERHKVKQRTSVKEKEREIKRECVKVRERTRI